MEVNKVTALVMSTLVMSTPVMSTPVNYAAVNQTPTWTALVITDCEDKLNALSNCYACNKPRHVT